MLNLATGKKLKILLKTHLLFFLPVGFITDTIGYNLRHQLRALRDLITPNNIAIFGMSRETSLSAFLGLETYLGIDGVAAGYAGGV